MFCIFQGLYQKSIKEGVKSIKDTKLDREGNIITRTLEASETHPSNRGPGPHKVGPAGPRVGPVGAPC